MVNQIISQFTNRLTSKFFSIIENTIEDNYCQHVHSTINTTISTSNCKNNNDILFPLFRLPIDLISKTSLFLNKQDILKFEQCCRSFYKMINKTSYLTQSNTFKHFIITQKRLNQMRNCKYSFFKYSKAHRLTFNISLGSTVATLSMQTDH